MYVFKIRYRINYLKEKKSQFDLYQIIEKDRSGHRIQITKSCF